MMNKNKGYVNQDYLNQAAQMFAPIKLDSYEKLRANSIQSLIDVGCGTGIDTTTIAQLNPEIKNIVGVDFDKDMIEQADKLAEQKECSDRTRHQHANSYDLPFEDNSFDAVRAERLFMHLEEPEKALREMLRVAKPGGRLVIVETDWASMSVNNGMDELERRTSHYFASEFLNNGYSARRLPGQLKAAGLEKVDIEIRSLQSYDYQLWLLLSQHSAMMQKALQNNFVSQTEFDDWNSQLESNDRKKSFFSTINIMSFSCET
ncbi:methyltransferase domain-containing protein [uncultured Pseudoteredinibacter sp.]|uniref:methyltransferase domain-containing protein n=1 Tax=uncultured Pseudoteredinibacter sp. TaxID=1641701 RepID=UPI00261F7B37|nr:methyltransferase domain-containing protein [uncultured Pseudoteredinibacter sp.]